MRGMAKGMDIVGQRYEEGKYFLSELIMAGETMKEGMEILKPFLEKSALEKLGRVVIGTVSGDLHDIGKNIVAMLLTGAGFEVVDLGVDTTAHRFLDTLRIHSPDILALSALLTVAIPEMRNVIAKVEEAGLRGSVRVIVGGTPLTDDYAREIGADAYGASAVDGVRICKEWMSKTNR
jgi:methanogenic corrinoid protein MtbC1